MDQTTIRFSKVNYRTIGTPGIITGGTTTGPMTGTLGGTSVPGIVTGGTTTGPAAGAIGGMICPGILGAALEGMTTIGTGTNH